MVKVKEQDGEKFLTGEYGNVRVEKTFNSPDMTKGSVVLVMLLVKITRKYQEVTHLE